MLKSRNFLSGHAPRHPYCHDFSTAHTVLVLPTTSMSPYGAEACFVETIWCTSTHCSVMSLYHVPLHWPLQEGSSQYCPVSHPWTTLRCKHCRQFWKHSSTLGLEVSCKHLNFSVKCTSVTSPWKDEGIAGPWSLIGFHPHHYLLVLFNNWQAMHFGALLCRNNMYNYTVFTDINCIMYPSTEIHRRGHFNIVQACICSLISSWHACSVERICTTSHCWLMNNCIKTPPLTSAGRVISALSSV